MTRASTIKRVSLKKASPIVASAVIEIVNMSNRNIGTGRNNKAGDQVFKRNNGTGRKRIRATQKLIKCPMATEIGMISLGKYTFFTRFRSETRDDAPTFNDMDIKFHGNRPQRRNIGKGTSTGTFTINEKTMDSTIICSSGFRSIHRKPRAALLYLTLKSLMARL